VEVENIENHKKVMVRINDRGPFIKGRIIDLSRKAARRIDMHEIGTASVQLRIIKQPQGDFVPPASEITANPLTDQSTTPPTAEATPGIESEEVIMTPINREGNTLPPEEPLVFHDPPASSNLQSENSDTKSNEQETTFQVPEKKEEIDEPAKTNIVPSKELIKQDGELEEAGDPQGFLLQVGAFSGRKNAQRHLKKLLELFPDIAFRVVPSGGLYKIYSPSLSSRPEALRLQSRLKQKGVETFLKKGSSDANR